MGSHKVWPGRPYPLGATYDGTGTNFSLFSEVAESVELCLFDDSGTETRVDPPRNHAFCRHGYLPGVEPGQRYGFRVHGPWAPEKGLRCNPAKLLLDPYAKAIEGQVEWDEAVFPYRFDKPEGPANDEDSAPFVPKSVVINPFFDWERDEPLRTPWQETIVYETHVKGLTVKHPDIPEEVRGTYAGLGHPATVAYLKKLGVTAVELLPVHQFIHDKHLVERRLRNYWGYNTIGFFAPHNGYSSRGQRGQQVQEFKQMVQEPARPGHRGDPRRRLQPYRRGQPPRTDALLQGHRQRGLLPAHPDNPTYYMDYTGTGNSLNMRHPHVLQLIMDSLRYWVLEMHVDGFRFDLAAALARELHEVGPPRRVLRHHPAGPRHGPGETHRRAVGRRGGGLPGGQLPAPAGPNGTASTGTACGISGAGRARRLREFAYRITGSSTSTRARAAGPSPASTSSPATTASP